MEQHADRNKKVVQMILDGVSQADICRAMGITRSTISGIVYRVREAGGDLAKALEQFRRPRGAPKRRPVPREAPPPPRRPAAATARPPAPVRSAPVEMPEPDTGRFGVRFVDRRIGFECVAPLWDDATPLNLETIEVCGRPTVSAGGCRSYCDWHARRFMAGAMLGVRVSKRAG